MPQPEEVSKINARLKAGQHKARVELVGNQLYLRATLVDREVNTIRRQQRIALGLPLTAINLVKAEAEALRLSLELQAQEFSWEKWAPKGLYADRMNVSSARFKDVAWKLHLQQYADKEEAGKIQWRKLCQFVLARLPETNNVTERTLIKVIESWPPNSATRKRAGVYLAKVAEHLKIPTEILRERCKGYGLRHVSPRDIPTDEAILDTFAKLSKPQHRYVFACCAIFGLRPHEVSDLTFRNTTQVETSSSTKTGSRIVWACPSAWVESMRPHELPRPTTPARKISDKLSLVLRRLDVTWALYHLRHAYALRLLVHGVPPEIGARLMGHSLQMHEQTYKRWLQARHLDQTLSRFQL